MRYLNNWVKFIALNLLVIVVFNVLGMTSFANFIATLVYGVGLVCLFTDYLFRSASQRKE